MERESTRLKYVPGSNGEPKHFTLSEEEQTWRVLEGKCPHNEGWRYEGHGHNDEAWSCKICNEYKWW